MAAESVVLHSESESRHHAAALGGAHGAVVGAGFLGKRSCFPALHPGGDHRNVIDPAAFHRHIAANFLETLAAEDLACARHMLDTHEAVIVSSVLRILEGGSHQSQLPVPGQLAQQELEVALVKRNIAVQTDDRLVRHILHPGITGVKRLDFAGEVPFLPLGHAKQLNPGILGRIPVYDLVGPVCRAVADDDPFRRRNRLRHYGLQRPLDEGRLVARRCDENVRR